MRIVLIISSIFGRTFGDNVGCAPLWLIVAVQQQALSMGLPAKPRKP
uniref:Uncharacterized protein n=1 Tax=Ralstonia pickettii (strain 12D) TaxID=428406 RepID=C6BF44_RALP1